MRAACSSMACRSSFTSRVRRSRPASGPCTRSAIFFVSHKLDEVFALADRVTVLRDGKVAAANEPMATMTRQRLVSLMIGREERVANLKARKSGAGEVVLEARGLSTSMGHQGID